MKKSSYVSFEGDLFFWGFFFHKNTASHGWSSAASKSDPSAGELPHSSLNLPPPAGNAIRHVPRAPRTTQEGTQGHTHTHTHRPACARTHTFTPALGHSAHTHTLYTSQESSGCEVDGFVASGVGGLQEFHNKRRFRRFLSPGSEHHTQTPDFLFGEYERDAGALCLGARQTARGKTLQTVV